MNSNDKQINNQVILGAGITGLSVGFKSGIPIYEAKSVSGGICASYYIRPDQSHETIYERAESEEDYRFELGGGHWIFGGDGSTLEFMNDLTPLKRYERQSSVYLPSRDLLIPYPIQNHLCALGEPLAKKIFEELNTRSDESPVILQDWLMHNFGPTLNQLFFKPFHDLYTAGLTDKIAPQDSKKTPLNMQLIQLGLAASHSPASGYNATFLYPENGLNTFMRELAKECNIHFGKQVTKICLEKKTLEFSDNSRTKFDKLISTLPLHTNLELTGLTVDETPDPYTSVLVINIGAVPGKNCPKDHWVYVPYSKSGFHRVGFYSNVDQSFLPKSHRNNGSCVSLYVEKAYLGGTTYPPEDIDALAQSIVNELIDWGFIKSAEITHPTWIKTAYTWSRPNSSWKEKSIELLKSHNIHSVGRYGRWHFQGIAESMQEGFELQKM